MQLLDELYKIGSHASCSGTYRPIVPDLDNVRSFDFIYSAGGYAVAQSIEIAAVPHRDPYSVEEIVINIRQERSNSCRPYFLQFLLTSSFSRPQSRPVPVFGFWINSVGKNCTLSYDVSSVSDTKSLS